MLSLIKATHAFTSRKESLEQGNNCSSSWTYSSLSPYDMLDHLEMGLPQNNTETGKKIDGRLASLLQIASGLTQCVLQSTEKLLPPILRASAVTSNSHTVPKAALAAFSRLYSRSREMNVAEPSHLRMFERLWDFCIGDIESGGKDVAFSLKNKQWKSIGFRTSNPGADLVAVGMLGLDNLLYLAQHESSLFEQLKTVPQYALIALASTKVLLDVLGLSTTVAPEEASQVNAELAAAARWFEHDEDAFSKLYCQTVQMLVNADLTSEFTQVLSSVRLRLSDALLASPRDFDEFNVWIHEECIVPMGKLPARSLSSSPCEQLAW